MLKRLGKRGQTSIEAAKPTPYSMKVIITVAIIVFGLIAIAIVLTQTLGRYGVKLVP